MGLDVAVLLGRGFAQSYGIWPRAGEPRPEAGAIDPQKNNAHLSVPRLCQPWRNAHIFEAVHG